MIAVDDNILIHYSPRIDKHAVVISVTSSHVKVRLKDGTSTEEIIPVKSLKQMINGSWEGSALGYEHQYTE